MIQATTSWAPHFCLNSKLFELNHVQTPEPQARSLLETGNIDAALTSEPPDTPYTNPTVSAPVALTGFGIAYDVDGDDGSQVPTLHLDARLLAKLLTGVLSGPELRQDRRQTVIEQSAEHHAGP